MLLEMRSQFEPGTPLAAPEVRWSGATDLGEKALHLNAVLNDNGDVQHVVFQSI